VEDEKWILRTYGKQPIGTFAILANPMIVPLVFFTAEFGIPTLLQFIA
jgi:hypothetical protein